MSKKKKKTESKQAKANTNKRARRIYFVDFENVHNDALKYSEEVQKGDEIIIFCTSQQKKCKHFLYKCFAKERMYDYDKTGVSR